MAAIAHNDWRLIPPSSKQPCYQYTISRGRESAGAYLTYELTSSPARNLLLVKRSPLQPLRGFLSQEDLTHLSEIIRTIERHREAGKGAITTAKSIVNSVYEGALPIPGLSVAVHKHGPVPVYVLPGEHNLELYGHRIKTRIGIYQNIFERAATRNRWPSVIADKTQFLHSLERHLQIIITRYLEDIGELFFDIEHHLNFPEAVQAALEIESTLAESVKEKVDVVLDHSEYPESAALAARRLLDDYSDVLLIARYARLWALFFLNQLYRILGLADYADDYRSELDTLKEEIDQSHSGGFQEFARDRPEIADLEAALRRFWRGGDQEASSPEEWVQHFVQFSHFIEFLRSENITPHHARIFLSTQHDIPVPENVRRITKDFLEANYGAYLRPMIVDEDRAGVLFKDKIRTQIWLSDSILAVAPKGITSSAGENGKDLSWIVREVDHGLGLSKRVALFMEEGADRASMFAQFTRTDLDFLAPRSRRPDRSLKLRSLLEDYTVARFESQKIDWIKSLQEMVNDEARLALELHFRNFFRTVLSFFSDREIRALRILHEKHSRSPLTKKQLAPLIFRGRQGTKAESEFDNFRRRVLNRRLVLDGVSYEIVARLPGNRYKSQLLDIASKLRPDVNKTILDSWILRLLDSERN